MSFRNLIPILFWIGWGILLLGHPRDLLAADFKWSCASQYPNPKNRKAFSTKEDCKTKGLHLIQLKGCAIKNQSLGSCTSVQGYLLASRIAPTIWKCQVDTNCSALVLEPEPGKMGRNCKDRSLPVDFGDIYDLEKIDPHQFCIHDSERPAQNLIQTYPGTE